MAAEDQADEQPRDDVMAVRATVNAAFEFRIAKEGNHADEIAAPQQQLRVTVQEARDGGFNWDVISAAPGITPEEASNRFRRGRLR